MENNFQTVRVTLQEEQEKGSGLAQLQKETLQELYVRLDELLTTDQSEKAQHKIQMYLLLLSILNKPVETTTPLPDLPFELAVIQWCLGDENGDLGETQIQKTSKQSTDVSKSSSASSTASTRLSESKVASQEETQSDQEDSTQSTQDSTVIATTIIQQTPSTISTTSGFWKDLRKQLKTTHPSLEALLTNAVPISFEKNILKIGVGYSLHKDRLSQDVQRRLVEDCLQKSLAQENLSVTYVVIDKAQLLRTQPDEAVEIEKSDQNESVEDADLLSAVSEALLD